MKHYFLKIYFLIAFLIYSAASYSQDRTIDSLEAIVRSQIKDTATANAVNKLTFSFLFSQGNCDSGSYYSNLSEKISEDINYKPGIAEAKYYQGVSLRCKGDYTNAYIAFLKSKEFFGELKKELFVVKCFRNIGSIFKEQGNSADAVENFFSAFNLSEEIKDTLESMKNLVEGLNIFYADKKYEKALEYAKKAETYAYSQPQLHPRDIVSQMLGYIYQAMKNDSLAMHYQMESLHLSEIEKDTLGIANSNMDLGNFFTNTKPERSLQYFLKAEQKYGSIKDSSGISNSVSSQALTYLHLDKPEIALQLYLRSLHFNELEKDSSAIANNYSSIGQTYLKMKQYDKALHYFQTDLKLSELLKDQAMMKDAYEKSSIAYEKLNRPAEALINYKKFIGLKDSIDKKNQSANLVGIEVKRSFEKVVQENKVQQAKDRSDARTKIYSLLAGSGVLLLLAVLLYRNNKQKQKANIKIETAFEKLKSTQKQLIQSEKMASLGELTAGIAHEIQNPLNFVNNFSDVNKDLLAEMNEEIQKGNYDEVKAIAEDVTDNETKINHHGKRADAIVKGMLQHSRSSTGVKELTDIDALADEYLRLSYHGLRAKDKSFNATMKTDLDPSIGKINIIPQDIGRVLLNLYNNAFYAVNEKQNAERLKQNAEYHPTVSVQTKKINNNVVLTVMDNGNGIPQKVIDKIFQPFFTTKPTGQGTGLGLSLSYDIIKAHGGEIKVETKEGEGSKFIINLNV